MRVVGCGMREESEVIIGGTWYKKSDEEGGIKDEGCGMNLRNYGFWRRNEGY